MTMNKNIFLSLILLLAVAPAWPALSHTVQLSTGLESNISFPTRMALSGLYRLGLEHEQGVQAGFMIKPGPYQVTAWHIQYDSPLIVKDMLQIHARAMNTRYHAFNRADNALLGWMSLDYRFIEADLGVMARFLNMDPGLQSLAFYYPLDLVQWNWLVRLAFFYDWQRIPLQSRLEFRDFGDHYADNSLVISYHLVHRLELVPGQDLILDAGLHPSGLAGLSIIYNKFTLDLKWELGL